MTEDGEEADIGWIRKNLGFVADPHRICVGITRSKFGLVIVGKSKLLCVSMRTCVCVCACACMYVHFLTIHMSKPGYLIAAVSLKIPFHSAGNEKVLNYDRIWKKLIADYKKKMCFVKGDVFPPTNLHHR